MEQPETQQCNVSAAEQQAQIDSAVTKIREQLPKEYAEPSLGIMCGSGQSSLADLMTEPFTMPYTDIPCMTQSTVSGHQSKLVIGKINSVVVACFLGRLHYYEGHSLSATVFPVRILAKLGVRSVLITNAAGAIDQSLHVGDIVVISDHISFLNMAGINPLRGENLASFGPRFPAMTEPYHYLSLKLVSEAAGLAGINKELIRQGVYVGLGGPSYETRAEVRLLRLIGGSVVGMSTVSEVVAAVHSGLKVVALSLVTNLGISYDDDDGDRDNDRSTREIPAPTHEEVLLASKTSALEMERLVFHLVPLINVNVK